MQYLGDYRIDDYITFGAQLHRFSSGAVYAPTGNVTYTFYENNSTSGAPTGGNLAQLNSKTGLYTARVQLTAANGFEVGKEYLIHIEATVDSVAAAELLMFRTVANPKVDVDTIKTQTVTCDASVTVLASVGTAATSTAQTGDSYARLGAPAGASVSADIADIEGKVDDLEGRLTAARAGYLDNINNAALQTTVAQTGDSYARLGAPAGASVSADIAAVKADTAAILEDTDDIGVAGAGLTAIPWNAAWDAEVQSEATDALNAYDPPTKAELDAAVAPLALEASVAIIDNYVDDLETRLTADRAGYLDNLSGGAVATAASVAALNNLSAAQINAEVVDVLRTDTIPDSYASDGAQPTIAQAILSIQQFLQERAVSGTTVTVKKPDGSSTAMTFTLNDGTNPTSITRAS